jgi:hypothetical protein
VGAPRIAPRLRIACSGYLGVAVPCTSTRPHHDTERIGPVRRLVVTGVALAALVPAATASATTPPEPTEPASSDTSPASTADTTASEEPASEGAGEEPAAETATVYDESGNAVARIVFGSSEVGFSDYEEGNDPDEGREYVRVVVTVESLITEGTFNIGIDDFVLQSNHGFVTTGENVPTAAQAEAGEDITEEADLANGESVELTVTFEVVASVGPDSVFYSPEDDRLVDVAELS